MGEKPFCENLQLEHPMCDCSAAVRRLKKETAVSCL
jgi:hypothetical protein